MTAGILDILGLPLLRVGAWLGLGASRDEEASYPGYRRQHIKFEDVGERIVNANRIMFPDVRPPGAPVVVRAWLLFDAPEGGNLLTWSSDDSEHPAMDAGDTVVIGPGRLAIRAELVT